MHIGNTLYMWSLTGPAANWVNNPDGKPLCDNISINAHDSADIELNLFLFIIMCSLSYM